MSGNSLEHYWIVTFPRNARLLDRNGHTCISIMEGPYMISINYFRKEGLMLGSVSDTFVEASPAVKEG